jgi:Zn-dependent protease
VSALTSLALGALLTWAGGATESVIGSPASVLDRLGPLASLLLYLGPVNIILGLFNLIPGFPLDGGRVLRAALWSATGDVRRATRWAAWAGQVVGWIFVIAGLATRSTMADLHHRHRRARAGPGRCWHGFCSAGNRGWRATCRRVPTVT